VICNSSGLLSLNDSTISIITALSVIVADFIRVTHPLYTKQNMVLTDQHDIETTMLNFKPVLNALIFEYSSKPEKEHQNLKDQIVETISSISYLKLLNEKENLKLKFSAGFQDLISFTNSNIDFEQYLIRTLGKSPEATITESAVIIEMVESLRLSKPDELQITNGHDLLNAFAKYFREIEARIGVTGEQLETSLRMVFSNQLFEQTEIYGKLIEWQHINETQLF